MDAYAADLINWYPDLLLIMLLDLLVATLLLTSLRFLAGRLSQVSSTVELAQRDNPAFGIALAGSVAALGIVLTGALTGTVGQTLWEELLLCAAYGLLGIVLLTLARFFFAILCNSAFSLRTEILRGNVAVGLAAAGNALATAIAIRRVMIWVTSDTLDGLLVVLVGYLFSQVVLSLLFLLRKSSFSIRHRESSLLEGLRSGQNALAVRLCGHEIGTALAITAASGFIPFAHDQLLLRCLLWGGMALIMAIFLNLLAAFALRAILSGIRVAEEVEDQANVGLATVDAAVHVTMGLLLAALFA